VGPRRGVAEEPLSGAGAATGSFPSRPRATPSRRHIATIRGGKTCNRDPLAMHVKLDELIRATDEARNRIIGSEKLSETLLDQLEHEEE
jgi:hypothetical protein